MYRSDDQSTLSCCSLMKTVTALDASRTLTGYELFQGLLDSFVELEICDSSKSTWS